MIHHSTLGKLLKQLDPVNPMMFNASNCYDGLCSCGYQVEDIDLLATNGVMHSITRVLLPPPVFVKEVLSDSDALMHGTSAADKEQPTLDSSGLKPSATNAGNSG